jgi:hypothetical protein
MENDLVWIDPPSGWMYGFPKVYNRSKNPNLHEWLVDMGYPADKIAGLGDSFYVRILALSEEELKEYNNE